MFKKLFVRNGLIKKSPQVAVHLAEDEHGTIAKDVRLGDISQSILTQTFGSTILGLMLVTYFRGYIPGTYGGLLAYLAVFVLGFIYWRVAIREYRGTCTIAMRDIIPEYTHHELSDRRILRKVLNKMRIDGRKSSNFTKEARALFLKYRKEEANAQAEYDKIIEEASK